MFVKVCGITTARQIDWAVELGYAAVGVVLHPASARYCNALRAAELAGHARGKIASVAVGFTFEEVAGAYHYFDYVQIYEHRDLDRVICAGDSALLARKASLFMYDTSRGTGRASALPQWLHGVREKLIISGGLSAAHIAGVVRDFRPFGVDVSSGVESAPGKKEYGHMKHFINEVTYAVK
jgi:phosphoribosylanthranilate isomerase